MDALAALALLDPPQGGEVDPSGLAQPLASDGEPPPLLGDAAAVLGLLHVGRQVRRIRPSKVNSKRRTAARKQLRAKINKFNSSGRAVTADDLMSEGRHRIHVRGSSGWRKWLPEAIQRAAFQRGSLSQVAQSMADAQGPTASG